MRDQTQHPTIFYSRRGRGCSDALHTLGLFTGRGVQSWRSQESVVLMLILVSYASRIRTICMVTLANVRTGR